MTRVLAPSGRGGEFTQPSFHLLAEYCSVSCSFTVRDAGFKFKGGAGSAFVLSFVKHIKVEKVHESFAKTFLQTHRRGFI